MGIESPPVPEDGLTENFSSIAFREPPPEGGVMAGGWNAGNSDADEALLLPSGVSAAWLFFVVLLATGGPCSCSCCSGFFSAILLIM
jgi:hypothetical protein